MAERPTLFRLETPIRNYAWGSHELLAQIRGADAPTLEPEAELWIGAHDADPALALGQGPLNQAIADDPERFLGSSALARFGPRLPFLLKVLAVGKPLSLQVHPTLEQARVGYRKETEAGISLSSPNRTFVDENHKPELLVAVSDFHALVGIREPDDATTLARLLIANGAHRLASVVLAPILNTPTVVGLRQALQGLVGRPDDETLIEETVFAATRIASTDEEYASSARWFLKIAELFPTRPDVVATLLLNHVHLRPGQAIYVAPGQIHSYLGGLGIEIMSSSDNVVRGGLTPKRIDVSTFFSMVDWTQGANFRIEGAKDGATTTWNPPITGFRLSRIECQDEAIAVASDAPAIFFASHESAVLTRGSERHELKQGESIYAAPGSPILVSGSATLWCASC